MKLKIQIIGPKVHGVDYRPLLTDMAIDTGLDGFFTCDRKYDKIQSVLVLAEGDDDSVAYFEKLVREKVPQLAKVDRIDTESFTGSVMPLYKYAAINTSSQMNKAILLLLSMNGKMDSMLEKQDDTISEIRDLHEDLINRSDFRLTRIEKDIKTIKAKLSLR